MFLWHRYTLVGYYDRCVAHNLNVITNLVLWYCMDSDMYRLTKHRGMKGVPYTGEMPM